MSGTLKYHWLACVLIIASMLAVVGVSRHLSLTWDEPFHLWAGLEWWEDGTYTRGPIDPPLPRISAAAPVHWFFEKNGVGAALQQYSPREAYMYRMGLMRFGTLPYYVLSCLLVLAWSWRLFGPQAAVWSVALYALLPTVTGHAALAATDTTYTAMFLAALMSCIAWLEKPDTQHALVAGICTGLMVGSKFSGLGHLPAALLAITAAQWIARKTCPIRGEHIFTGLLCALPMVALVLGLLYRFEYGQIVKGVSEMLDLNHGYGIWMFHALYNHPVWYFFPVLIFFKTPLPFHIAAFAGGWRLCAEKKIERLFPLLAAAGVLAVNMASHFDAGVRHIMPVFPLLAIPAGYEMMRLWQSVGGRRVAAYLLALQAGAFALSYRDPIAYYNFLAGPHPERIELDSDYDWRQAFILLDEDLMVRDISAAYLCVNKPSPRDAYPMHVRDLGCPDLHTLSGWVVAGRSVELVSPGQFVRLRDYKRVADIGTVYDLYFLPPAAK